MDVICVHMHEYSQLHACDVFSLNIMHHLTAMAAIPYLHLYIGGSPVACSQQVSEASVH